MVTFLPPSCAGMTCGKNVPLHSRNRGGRVDVSVGRSAQVGVANNAQLGSEAAELVAQTKLLREIFGDPFRPLSVDPSWLTLHVVELAQTIYDDRGFDRMPALADALEMAGCDNRDTLAHCRCPEPHFRGCWLLDSILGKE
jgi:hypothetical protein